MSHLEAKSKLISSQRKMRLAIVGSGFSATTLLAELSLQPSSAHCQITIITDGTRLGRGTAYGVAAQDKDLLLNVPVSKMSLYNSQPQHFLQWLNARGYLFNESDFAPRAIYGKYLSAEFSRLVDLLGVHLIQDRVLKSSERPRLGSATASALLSESSETSSDSSVFLYLQSGQELEFDQVVVATGYIVPRLPREFRSIENAKWIDDPFTNRTWQSASVDDEILVLGTGLTAVDLILRLSRLGFKKITTLSRRGQLPHSHAPATPLEGSHSHLLNQKSLLEMFRLIRDEAEDDVRMGRPWQMAMERVRHQTSQAWLKLSNQDRARFLRHVRPYWDSHRHRLPRSTFSQIQQLKADGVLKVIAGRVTDLKPSSTEGDSQQLNIRQRQDGQVITVRPSYVLNATGYEPDTQWEARDMLGKAGTRIYVLGPALRTIFWEMTAAPDLRAQATRLVQDILEVLQTRTSNFSEFGELTN